MGIKNVGGLSPNSHELINTLTTKKIVMLLILSLNTFSYWLKHCPYLPRVLASLKKMR